MMILPLVVVLGLFFLLYRAERSGTPLFGGGDRQGVQGSGPCPGCGHHHPHHPFGPHEAPEDEAMRTLANRLASGDITPEDYRDRVEALRTTRAQAYDPTAGMPYLGPEDRAGQEGPQS